MQKVLCAGIYKKIKLLLLRIHMDVNKNNSFINVVSAQSSALPRHKNNSIYHNVLPANFTLPAISLHPMVISK